MTTSTNTTNKTINIIDCSPDIVLNDMTVFDIGANKEHINMGATVSSFSSQLSSALIAISSQKTNKNTPVVLNIPGYAIDLLEKQHPQTLTALKSLVDNHNIAIAANTYYGSSPEFLEDDDFKAQSKRHASTVNKVFSKDPSIIHPFTAYSQSQLQVLTGQGNSILEKNRCVHSTIYGQKNSSQSFSNMSKHIVSELKAMYPHIKQSGDSRLLTSWRLLTSNNVIQRLSHNTFDHSSYEHYTAIMTICNDIAHTIRNVKSMAEGVFVEQPEIVERPSSLLTIN